MAGMLIWSEIAASQGPNDSWEGDGSPWVGDEQARGPGRGEVQSCVWLLKHSSSLLLSQDSSGIQPTESTHTPAVSLKAGRALFMPPYCIVTEGSYIGTLCLS